MSKTIRNEEISVVRPLAPIPEDSSLPPPPSKRSVAQASFNRHVCHTVGKQPTKNVDISDKPDPMALSSYAMQIIGGGILMTMCYYMGKYDYSLMYIAIFVALNFYKSKLWKQRQKKLMSMRDVSLREKEVVMAQLQDLPAWVQFPDTERVEWLNKVILQAWPYIGEFAKTFIKEEIEPMVRAQLPAPFKSFRFERMDMGDIPFRVYTENVGRDRIVMDMDIAYAGDLDFVVSVGGFKGGMNNMQFTGKLRAVLSPLIPYPPMVGGVSAFLLDAPKLDFNLTGAGEMVELPGLMTAVRAVVQMQIANILVLPNQITIPLVPTLDLIHMKFPEPDGVVRIHIVEARNLENKDMSFIKKGRSDPYAIVTVGAQNYKTKTINNNLNPVWNEFYEAVVQQASGQRLRIELYDKDTASKDEELGRVSLDLADVRTRGCIDTWYPLEGVEKGELHLKVYWMSLTRDPRDLEVDNWEKEWLSSNRPMHSALLSVYVDNVADLPFPRIDTEPSPVIILSIGQEKESTLPKFKTINPIYQEKFHFFVSHPENQEILIEAYDGGPKGKSLGKSSVSLKPLLTERNMELYQHTVPLMLGTHTSPLIMTLRLRPLRGAAPTNVDGGEVEKANKLHNGAQLRPTTSYSSVPRSTTRDSDTVSVASQHSRRSTSVLYRMRSKAHKMKKMDDQSMTGDHGRIRVILKYANSSLVLRIVGAEQLQPLEVEGRCDPYVKIVLISTMRESREKQKTLVALNTLAPVWEESFNFDIDQSAVSDYVIKLTVKDGESFGILQRPPVLGKADVDLSTFNPGQPFDRWIELRAPNA